MNPIMAIDKRLARAAYPRLFAYWERGIAPTEAEIGAFQAATQRRQPPARGVAVLPVQGVLMRRPGIIEQMFGAVSLEGFMAAFRAMVADPEVGTIILDIDSPGGETDGVPEAAAEIRAARATNNIVSIANSMACSAAYWLGSAAQEFVATQMPILGNIGVYLIHDDYTAALESEGVKRDVIASSELKAAYTDGATLTDDARAQLQAIVDEQYGLFLADVAKGRGVSKDKVRKDYGGGGIFGAAAALAAGMIDRTDTLEGSIRKAVTGKPRAELEAEKSLDVTVTIQGESIIEPPKEPTPEPPVPAVRGDYVELARLRQRQHAR